MNLRPWMWVVLIILLVVLLRVASTPQKDPVTGRIKCHGYPVTFWYWFWHGCNAPNGPGRMDQNSTYNTNATIPTMIVVPTPSTTSNANIKCISRREKSCGKHLYSDGTTGSAQVNANGAIIIGDLQSTDVNLNTCCYKLRQIKK